MSALKTRTHVSEKRYHRLRKQGTDCPSALNRRFFTKDLRDPPREIEARKWAQRMIEESIQERDYSSF